MPSIALLTCARLPRLADDEHPLLDALATRGIRAEPAVWDDPRVDWSRFDAAVVRSVWDYHLRYDEFFDWLTRVEGLGVSIWNPPHVLRWNSRKTYLQELSTSGVHVVPTVWVDETTPEDEASLTTTLEQEGWPDAVVKPVVSASAHDTWRLTREEAARDPSHDEQLRRIAKESGAMVQPVVPEIVSAGEWSLLFFDGVFSHAVVKRAAAGEFRVQREFGGTFENVTPSAAVLRQAEVALAAAPGRTLYARVDGVVIGDALTVTELELLEPSLFLDADPAAPDRFAAAIARVTSGERPGS